MSGWILVRGGSNGPIITGPGQSLLKPAAAQQLNLSNPLTNGLIFYGLDNGNGTYTNLLAPPAIQYGQVALTDFVQTEWGLLTRWPGIELGSGYHLPGEGVYRTINDPYLDVVAATDLTIKAAGAGNTFACGCIRLDGFIGADFDWIFGRTGISAGEHVGEPWIPVTWGFVEALPPNGEHEVGCYVMHGPTPGEFDVHVGNFTLAVDTFTSFLCSTINTTGGHALSSFYAQGAFVSSAAVDMWCYNPFNTSETEIMFGGTIHTDTTNFHHAFGGYIPYGAFWDRALSAQEAASLHANPYQFLISA